MTRKKLGAPTKADGGLTTVIYVRASKDLVKALDERLRQERTARPGRGVSRSDLVRDILYQTLRRSEEENTI